MNFGVSIASAVRKKIAQVGDQICHSDRNWTKWSG